MVGLKPLKQRVEQTLAAAYDGIGTANVLGEQQRAAGPEDAMGLRQRTLWIRNLAERVGEHHRVERRIGELQRFGVAESQVHLLAQLGGTSPGDRQHLRGGVQPGEVGAVSVVRKAEAGAYAHLEHASLRSLADPAAPTIKAEQEVPAAGAAVVRAGQTAVGAAHPLDVAQHL